MSRIVFTLNKKAVEWDGLASARLLDVLRDELFCVGVKCACREGECGACSVLINGELVNSCLAAMGSVEGADIITIEGFRETDRFAVLDAAFARHGAVQCGFCSPGMILASEALLSKNPSPTRDEIRSALSGNLCSLNSPPKLYLPTSLQLKRDRDRI